MADRVSRRILESLLALIAELERRPLEASSNVSGRYRSNSGALVLDHNSIYGGYRIEEMMGEGGMGEGGGVKTWTDRMSGGEMEQFLRGYLMALRNRTQGRNRR